MMNFNSLNDLSKTEIENLLSLARRLDEQPEPRALEGKVLSLLFLNKSLRTLASFQAAMIRLGGGTFVISPEMSIYGLESRSGIIMDGTAAEHLREAVPVIASYSDVIGIRAMAKMESLEKDLDDSAFKELVSHVDAPYINMESAIDHPCQNLADWKTLDDLGIPAQGGKFVLSWSWHPNALPMAVPASTLQMAALRGMDITVLRPDGFELPDTVMQASRRIAENNGGSIRESNNRNEAMEGARVLYVNSWSSVSRYGRKNSEEKYKAHLRDWCVDESWFGPAQADCRFMHPLPIRRGVTAMDEILDGPRSVVIAESRNRMLAQMAVLHRMLCSSS